MRGDVHVGCGERVGETDWLQGQHRAPARLNRHYARQESTRATGTGSSIVAMVS
jgi:hypothetical protein